MLSVLSSCSQDCETVTNKCDEREIELSLENQDSINLWCRSVFSFDAITEGVYSIESQDTSVVKVSMQNKHFTIKSVNLGCTNIVISNRKGTKKVIKCNSLGFTDYWKETTELARIYKNTMMVVANDRNVAELIRKELKPIYLNRGYEYQFIKGSDDMIVLALGGPKKGTYDFDGESQILTLKYENKCEKYLCDVQPPYPNLFPYHPHFIVALKQDLTKEYSSRYPQAGISDVYIIRYVIALGHYWLINKVNT